MNKYHKTDTYITEEMQQVKAAQLDPNLFGVLYDKYYKTIFVFIFRRTADEQLSADLTSHVFLVAMVNLHKFQFKGVPFSAWIFRIALNEVNGYFRKVKKQRIVSLEETDIDFILEEADLERQNENTSLLMNALSKLPPDSMQLIEMRFFEKMQFNEIADILSITEGNAKVKVYRILDKLKELIIKQKNK